MTICDMPTHEWTAVLKAIEALRERGEDVEFLFDYKDIQANHRLHRIAIVSPLSADSVIVIGREIADARQEWEEWNRAWDERHKAAGAE